MLKKIFFILLIAITSLIHAQIKVDKFIMVSNNNLLKPIVILQNKKLGTLSGVIKNESSTPLYFTSNNAEKGLYVSLHEIFEYPTNENKKKVYEYDMGQELDNYKINITKVNDNLYNYTIYDVPLNKKFLIKLNWSNLDAQTTVNSIANLNYTGAIIYIFQKGFNYQKYTELLNIITTSGQNITKNIIVKNGIVK
jgi:hypothetical protein